MSKAGPPTTVRLRADAVLIAVTAVWGVSFVVVKNALAESPPLPFLFWRFLFAAALLAAAVGVVRRPRDPRVLRDGTLIGLLLAGGMSLQVLGQVETTASKAAFLTGLSVVLTPFAAYLRARRVPSLENAIGIAFASVGFVLLSWPSGGGAINRGDLLVFACSIVFAFYIVELGERSASHDSLWLTAVQLGVVAVVAGILAIATRALSFSGGPFAAAGARPFVWTPSVLASILYLGSVGTVGTFLGQTWAQRHMTATHAAILLSLEPVFAALFAGWLLQERLGARGLTGGILVLAGIVVSEVRLRRRW